MSVIVFISDINTLQDYNIYEIQKQIILWKDSEDQENESILGMYPHYKSYTDDSTINRDALSSALRKFL